MRAAKAWGVAPSMEWVGSLLSVRWTVPVGAVAMCTQESPSEQYDDFCQAWVHGQFLHSSRITLWMRSRVFSG